MAMVAAAIILNVDVIAASVPQMDRLRHLNALDSDEFSGCH
jgi:hypothetical protein